LFSIGKVQELFKGLEQGKAIQDLSGSMGQVFGLVGRPSGTGGHWEALAGSGCHVWVAGSLGYRRLPFWQPAPASPLEWRQSAHGQLDVAGGVTEGIGHFELIEWESSQDGGADQFGASWDHPWPEPSPFHHASHAVADPL